MPRKTLVTVLKPLMNRHTPHPAQWLPKPATSQFPEKGYALRATWSPLRGEGEDAKDGPAYLTQPYLPRRQSWMPRQMPTEFFQRPIRANNNILNGDTTHRCTHSDSG